MFCPAFQSIKGNVSPGLQSIKGNVLPNNVKSIRVDPEKYVNIFHREPYGPPSRTLNWTQASWGGGGGGGVVCLFDLFFTSHQQSLLNRDMSSWVEPVLS